MQTRKIFDIIKWENLYSTLLRNLGSLYVFALYAYEGLDDVTLICRMLPLGEDCILLFTHCFQGEGLRMDSLNAAWYERRKRNVVITTLRLSDNILPMIWHFRSAGFGKVRLEYPFRIFFVYTRNSSAILRYRTAVQSKYTNPIVLSNPPHPPLGFS